MDQARRNLIEDAVQRSAKDPAYFLRFFLSGWFPSALPPVHLGILALLTKRVDFLNDYPDAHEFLLNEFYYEPDVRDTTAKRQQVFQLIDGKIHMMMQENDNIIMPRGFSKTTLLKGAVIYVSLHDGSYFTCFVSASAEHGEAQVNDCKTQFEVNELLRTGYGDHVAKKSDPEAWTQRKIVLKNNAIILARGRGGQVRGITENGKRPNWIVLDDIEDEDSVASEPSRRKTNNWMYSSVVPAGQIMEGAAGEEWAQEPLRISNLGTLLGNECLVQELTKDSSFGTIRFGAKLANGKMLWEYKMSSQLYEKLKLRWTRAGKASQFTREYDSLIRVSDEDLFPTIFRYEFVPREDLIAVAVAMDPAISEDRKADHAAIIVAGRKRTGGLIFLDEWGGIGKTPRDLINNFFRLVIRWNATVTGIEDVAYQAALLSLAREEMVRSNFSFWLKPIKARKTNKLARVEGMLSPRYTNGLLTHAKPLPNLEGNLLDWPNGKRDYPDAAAMALGLLGESVGAMLDPIIAAEEAAKTPAIAGPPSEVIISGHRFAATRGGNSLPPSLNSRYGR